MARRLPARLSANLCSQLGRNFLFAALLILGIACAQTSVRPIVRNGGTMPGAVVTAPVAALVPFGVSVGLTAGSVVATGLNNNASDIARMAASSADEIVCYLSEFFAKLGWIKADQVMKARIRY
jgi:hypothetical protein